MLAEDQYSSATLVTVAEISGDVIHINPRRTVARDFDGALHSLPNGAISIATKQTQSFGRIALDIPVRYDVDIERATRIISDEYERLASERPRDSISPTPDLVRVQSFMEDHVGIRLNGDVRPGRQWELEAELRRRLMLRFADEGISMLSSTAEALRSHMKSQSQSA
jgi:small-conductance mechanosensitive channel